MSQKSFFQSLCNQVLPPFPKAPQEKKPCVPNKFLYCTQFSVNAMGGPNIP